MKNCFEKPNNNKYENDNGKNNESYCNCGCGEGKGTKSCKGSCEPKHGQGCDEGCESCK